jgi:hypothetical protein
MLLLTGTSSSNLRALCPARRCVAGTERGAVKSESSPSFLSATRYPSCLQQLRAVDSTRHPRDSNSAGVLIPTRTFHSARTPHLDGAEVKPGVRYRCSLTAWDSAGKLSGNLGLRLEL